MGEILDEFWRNPHKYDWTWNIDVGTPGGIFVRKKENYFLGRTTQRVFVSPVPTGRVGGWISVKMSGRNPVIAPGKIFSYSCRNCLISSIGFPGTEFGAILLHFVASLENSMENLLGEFRGEFVGNFKGNL